VRRFRIVNRRERGLAAEHFARGRGCGRANVSFTRSLYEAHAWWYSSASLPRSRLGRSTPYAPPRAGPTAQARREGEGTPVAGVLA
jgi:hypothetical protein